MSTYLLTWNPNRWPWEDLAETYHRVVKEGFALIQWSCGRTRRIEVGDRVFMLRQGVEPRGIVASGVVVEPPYEAPHWDASASKPALYVGVKVDALLDPEVDEILPRELLDEPYFSGMHWNTQSSGISVPEHVAQALEREWEKWLSEVSSRQVTSPGSHKLSEGTAYDITLTGYERNREARRRCIAYYGSSCFVCGLDLGQTYGPAGENYIHVHHLLPLSEIGEQYEVDPVEEMRPVCPNCHAIIHRRSPPYEIEEVEEMMVKQRLARQRHT